MRRSNKLTNNLRVLEDRPSVTLAGLKMKIAKDSVIALATIAGYIIWYIFLASYYTEGDIAAYSKYYNLVSDDIHYQLWHSIHSAIENTLELQKLWLNSREPLFGLLVFLFAHFLEYSQYQSLSIIMFISGAVLFFRKIVGMPWSLIHATLLSSYAMVIAIPAERFRWAMIVFFWISLLMSRRRNSVWPAAISALGHIQVGSMAFAANFAKYKLVSTATVYVLSILVIFSGILIDQIQVKVFERQFTEGALSSAMLGIAMLLSIFALSSTVTAKLVVVPFLFFGFLFGFSRLNLSIWFLLLLILDFRNKKVRLFYFCLSTFLFFRMIQMVILVVEDGHAFQ